MRTLITLVAFAVLLPVGIAGQPRTPSYKPFAGTWRSGPTAGITTAEVRERNGQWVVHLWGRCHPRDCDWGEQRFVVLPPADPKSREADRGVATWPMRGNSGMRYVIFLPEDDELVIEVHTVSNNPRNVRHFVRERLTRSS